MKSDFCFLSGEDGTALAFLAQGGHGCISVTANVAPRLCSDLHQAWREKNIDKAQELNLKLSNYIIHFF
jgi:4-hydroxy-tetrahydrodipicolinate synthase